MSSHRDWHFTYYSEIRYVYIVPLHTSRKHHWFSSKSLFIFIFQPEMKSHRCEQRLTIWIRRQQGNVSTMIAASAATCVPPVLLNYNQQKVDASSNCRFIVCTWLHLGIWYLAHEEINFSSSRVRLWVVCGEFPVRHRARALVFISLSISHVSQWKRHDSWDVLHKILIIDMEKMTVKLFNYFSNV